MMVYPSRGSLDSWATMGNEVWDYESVVPYLNKFATVHVPQAAKDVVDISNHDDKLVGDEPVHASHGENIPAQNKPWMDTFKKLGFGMTGDARSGTVTGAFQTFSSIDPTAKTRSFAGTAHYSDEISSRKNLFVVTKTVVKKILFNTEGPEPVATGVVTVSEDGTEKILKSRDIILAAGCFMSPQILELSGIGSKALLDSFNIPVLVDNPYVGENLQDHAVTCQSFEVKPGFDTVDIFRDPAVFEQALEQYQSTTEGPLGQSNNAMAYIPLVNSGGRMTPEQKKEFFAAHNHHAQTPDGQMLRHLFETSDEPSIQYMLAPGQMDTTVTEPKSMLDHIIPRIPQNCISVLAFVNHPFSRGSVHINSADVHQLPTWDPNFYSNPLDLEIMARHVQFVEKVLTTTPFSDVLVSGGVRFPGLKANTLDDAKELARQASMSNYHPSGSCGMRPRDKGGVVDNRLRVYGVQGLRIVDASIFPLEPTGNIQTLVYAVAEKADDMIKEDRKANLV